MNFDTLIAAREAELSAARSAREAAKADQGALLAGVEAEQRTALTADEQTRFDALSTAKREADTKIAEHEAKLAELRAEKAADEKAERDAADVAPTGAEIRAYDEVARIGQEKRTYNPGNPSEGVSFLADVYRGQLMGDASANVRLNRHMDEERVEKRDVGTGAFAGLTVPQYLTDLVAPAVAKGRPLADNCRKLPLPPDGMTVNISRVTTATSATLQASENTAASETNIDDTLLTVNVRTISGQQDVSRQAVDRSVGAESVVIEDLAVRYHTALDNSIINDDGTSGTHLGIRSTSSIVAVTYTDSSPTPSEAWGPLWDLQQQIEAGVYKAATHLVMHPRRWAFFCSAIGTNQAMFGFSGVGVQLIGQEQSKAYGAGVRGILAGLPVIVDANLPTTVSSTQDVILGITADELFLWEQPGSPLLIRAEQTNAAELAVKYVVYGYSAFTAGRYPGAHGTISGSGLTTPTFGIAAS